MTVCKKVEEKGDGLVFPHVCNCEDIRLDPFGISDPAIMRLLLGETTTPFLLLSVQIFKKYLETVRKFLQKHFSVCIKKDWLWLAVQDVHHVPRSSQWGLVAIQW